MFCSKFSSESDNAWQWWFGHFWFCCHLSYQGNGRKIHSGGQKVLKAAVVDVAGCGHLDGGIVGVDIHNGELHTSVFVNSRGCAITGCVAVGLVVEASSAVGILVLVIIIQRFYCCYIMTFYDPYLK